MSVREVTVEALDGAERAIQKAVNGRGRAYSQNTVTACTATCAGSCAGSHTSV